MDGPPEKETAEPEEPADPPPYVPPIDYSLIHEEHMRTAGVQVQDTHDDGAFYRQVIEEIGQGLIPVRPIDSEPLPDKHSVRGIDSPVSFADMARRWVTREFQRNEYGRDRRNDYHNTFLNELYRDFVHALERGLHDELAAMPEAAEDIQHIVQSRQLFQPAN